jgi:hypothetical protein
VHESINAITREQVLAIVPAFVDGAVVAVRYHADATAAHDAGD